MSFIVALPGQGWQHSFISAYQMGCELLAALGRAEETDWGAIPHPRLPATLPRWDDTCAVILGLAEQSDLLSCRRPDGHEPLARAAWLGRRKGETLPPPMASAPPMPRPSCCRS